MCIRDRCCCQVNSPIQFVVDFNGVQGQLVAKVVAPSGAESDANVQQIQQGSITHFDSLRSILLTIVPVHTVCLSVCMYVCMSVCLSIYHVFVLDRYSVNFVPRESGLHYVHVKLNGVHVPGSPYPVQVGRVDADASQVRAYGDGLYKGFTGIIITIRRFITILAHSCITESSELSANTCLLYTSPSPRDS